MARQDGVSVASSDRLDSEQVILGKLREGQRFTVEELLAEMPELTWAQVFVAIDVLSRRGDIELRRQGFTYTVTKLTPWVQGVDGVDATAHPHHR